MIFRFLSISLIMLLPMAAFAASSTNAVLSQEETTVSSVSASSSNFKFDGAVGDGAVGLATSSNFTLQQGTTWFSASDNPTISINFSTPELRDVSLGDNYDAIYYLTVRTETNGDDVILYTTELATTSASGASLTDLTLTGVAPGTYDIGIKTHQTLTKVLQDVPIVAGNNVLNFSDANYAAGVRGSEVMLAGDIDGTGVDNTTLGDDLVNSVDLSVMLADLNVADSSGNQIRANVNQDITVNSVDLSIILGNLNVEGDN